MKKLLKYVGSASLLATFVLSAIPAQAAVFVQCPGDTDGDAAWDSPGEDQPENVKCKHISGGDGFANMGDGYLQYTFGFGELTGTLPEDAVDQGILNAQISAPSIVLDEGDEFYLTMTNVSMSQRPDLFDAHTVHFHGFPQASSVFDGVPDTSIAINQGASMTYYYNIVEPGTYLYHCHVEAAEHMQMGMIGNLVVLPAQDKNWSTTVPGADPVLGVPDPDGSGRFYTKFAYNDGNGSTGYDVSMPLQLTGFDPVFHDADLNVQPLPFAEMFDTYNMFNGRGYPATVQPGNYYETNPGLAQTENGVGNSQPYSSKIEVTKGQKLLLRINNVSITKFHTVTVLGLPMQVIARGANELTDKYYTSSVNVGGGEAYDVLVDTRDVPAGTYFVYVTELDQLSNNEESFGGPMTEIEVVLPAPAI